LRPYLPRAIAFAAVTLLSTTILAEGRFHPNSEKYRDSSMPNASARSGSASIEARALLNRDDSADVEVTTGTFDGSSPATGLLAKLQLDLPGGGRQNFNDLSGGGSFTTNVPGLASHVTLGIQANVRGVDGARTDVVSVDETVKLRPDLLVSGISAPSPAYRGLPAVVRATIREANGDVGARANCQLFSGDRLIDRADGIWVDASGTVDCVFTQAFDASHVDLTVAVTGVDPGDWDDENNSASVSLDLLEPPVFYSWSANAREEQFTRRGRTTYSWGDFNSEEHGFTQSFAFSGVIRAEVPHVGMKTTINASSDGIPRFSSRVEDFSGPFKTAGGYCSTGFVAGAEVDSCYLRDFEYLMVNVSFGTADAVYRSWGWATQRSPFSPPEPRFEWNDTRVDQTAMGPLGTSVSMDIQFEAGGSTFTAQPSFALTQGSTRITDQPYSCSFDDFLGQTVCRERFSSSVTRSGSASYH